MMGLSSTSHLCICVCVYLCVYLSLYLSYRYVSGLWDVMSRGHDNVHDDMNMYVIMHDQCLFIAMINSFHT